MNTKYSHLPGHIPMRHYDIDDNNRQYRPDPWPREERARKFKRVWQTCFVIIAILIGAALWAGCTVLKNSVTETVGQTNRTVTTLGLSFFDGKTVVSGLKAGQTGKSQTIGVSNEAQESSGTNTADLVERVVGAAVKAAIKP